MNVVISNNEVTRPNGNGIFVKAQSLGKSFWTEGVRQFAAEQWFS